MRNHRTPRARLMAESSPEVLPLTSMAKPGITLCHSIRPAQLRDAMPGCDACRGTPMTDETTELLVRQRALQAEAEQVRARLGLDRVLGSVGQPVLVGSAALGLMVWRDVDITVVCQSLDKRPVLAAATELAAHQDVKTMQFRDDSGRFNQDPQQYPDGLYIGLRFHPAEMAEWTLDLWFVDDPARQPDLAHLRALPERLTEDARLAILRIKTRWSARPEYGKSVRSWDIYTAVLDHNVRGTDEFDAWLAKK
jgi:hypothetical protein